MWISTWCSRDVVTVAVGVDCATAVIDDWCTVDYVVGPGVEAVTIGIGRCNGIECRVEASV